MGDTMLSLAHDGWYPFGSHLLNGFGAKAVPTVRLTWLSVGGHESRARKMTSCSASTSVNSLEDRNPLPKAK